MRRKIAACAVVSLLTLSAFAASASAQGSASEPEYRGGNSFSEDLFGDMKKYFGFSLGVYQMYDSNLFFSRTGREDGFVTTIFPRVFFNAGRRKTRFHADYGTGYWMYNDRGGLNSAGHFGNFQLTRQLSRRAHVSISDQISSSPNEYGSFMAPIFSPGSQRPSFSNEVLLERQRITRNNLTGSLNIQVGRRGNLGVFGSYHAYRFKHRERYDVNAGQAGVSYDHRITDWLHLSNSYHTYLNRVDERFRDARMHSLQVGGFNFRLGNHWSFDAGGGAQWASHQDRSHLSERISAGISRNSRNNSLHLRYQRGFTSAIGLSRLYQSDIVTAGLGQRISPRVSFRASSSYWSGSGIGSSEGIKSYMVQSGFDFLLRSDLVASVNGYYQDQTSRAFVGDSLDRERYMVIVGLQYLWPSVPR